MKRLFFVCFALLFVLVGCNSVDMKPEHSYELQSGYYFKAGSTDRFTTPYLDLDFEDNSFAFGAGTIFSYAEWGRFIILDDLLTATTQNTVFVFRLKDSSSMTLLSCGGLKGFVQYEGVEFTYYVME